MISCLRAHVGLEGNRRYVSAGKSVVGRAHTVRTFRFLTARLAAVAVNASSETPHAKHARHLASASNRARAQPRSKIDWAVCLDVVGSVDLRIVQSS